MDNRGGQNGQMAMAKMGPSFTQGGNGGFGGMGGGGGGASLFRRDLDALALEARDIDELVELVARAAFPEPGRNGGNANGGASQTAGGNNFQNKNDASNIKNQSGDINMSASANMGGSDTIGGSGGNGGKGGDSKHTSLLRRDLEDYAELLVRSTFDNVNKGSGMGGSFSQSAGANMGPSTTVGGNGGNGGVGGDSKHHSIFRRDLEALDLAELFPRGYSGQSAYADMGASTTVGGNGGNGGMGGNGHHTSLFRRNADIEDELALVARDFDEYVDLVARYAYPEPEAEAEAEFGWDELDFDLY